MKILSSFQTFNPSHSDGSFAQSALSLPQNYGLTLDSAVAGADSFYALTELFQASAYSICQLLNLLETLIDKRTGYNQIKVQDYSLDDLAYQQDVLKRLEPRLRETLADLESYQSSQWPRSYDITGDGTNTYRSKAVAAAESLLTDFKNLHSRAEQLSAQCQSGMSVSMNSAVVAES